MNKLKELVSVIIPTFSRPNNLIRAIESVLRQTYSPIEIIVVDDNGTGTEYQLQTESILHNLVESGKVSYIVHEKNRNGSAARNTGLYASKGTYINFLDDDDELGVNKIEKQVEKLRSNSDIDATYCDTVMKWGDKVRVINNDDSLPKIENILLDKLFLNTSTVLFRRDALIRLNGFDESFLRHQDYELYIRFFREFKMKKTECDYLIKYDAPNIVSKNPEKSVEFLEKFLDTFKQDLYLLPNYKKIYQYRYWSVLNFLLINRCYKPCGYCYRKSIEFSYPSLKSILVSFAYFVYPYIKPFIFKIKGFNRNK